MDVPAAASPPTQFPMQYSPALSRVTTGFGMGPGGATTLSATGTSHRQIPSCRTSRVAPGAGPAPPRPPRSRPHRVCAKIPSTIRTRQLQSVARCPPRAYQPGRLPGVSRHSSPGCLVLEGVSRLDAFSGSPGRTSLPSGAGCPTTGSRAVRSSRSSRTRDDPPQTPIRPQRIETELSHDVLNPARVPL